MSTARKRKNIIEDDTTYAKENTDESPAELETNGPETKNGIVDGAIFVKLRTRPDYTEDSFDRQELLTRGEKVVILKRGKEFYKVRTQNNHEGYVALSFLKEE